MTFEEWLNQDEPSRGYQDCWNAAQLAMRERAAEVVKYFLIPQDCDTEDMEGLADYIRALEPE